MDFFTGGKVIINNTYCGTLIEKLSNEMKKKTDFLENRAE